MKVTRKTPVQHDLVDVEGVCPYCKVSFIKTYVYGTEQQEYEEWCLMCRRFFLIKVRGERARLEKLPDAV